MQAKITKYVDATQKIEGEESSRETDFGLISNDWKVVQFDKCISKKRFKVGKVKKREYKHVGKYPIIDQSKDFIAGYTDDEQRVYKGNLPVVIFGDHTRIFKYVNFPFVLGADGSKILVPNEDLLYPNFLYYAFLNLDIQSLGYSRHFKLLKEKCIPLPPLSEQRKIAKALGTIQRAIEQQDKIIEAAKNLKKSLIQKLFTDGLGHTEFKETEIGTIPEEWEIKSAKEICLNVTDGTHDTPKPKKSGYYLVTSKHIKEGDIDFTEAYFISEDDFNEINRRSEVHPLDVIFSMIGTIGNVVVVKKEYPKFAIKNVGLFKTGRDYDKSHWLYYYFQSFLAHEYIKNNVKGTSQVYVPLYALRNFPIVMPPVNEMQEIVHILSTVDKKIDAEEKRKVTLKELFKTMLHKLMTGEIRLKDVEV